MQTETPARRKKWHHFAPCFLGCGTAPGCRGTAVAKCQVVSYVWPCDWSRLSLSFPVPLRPRPVKAMSVLACRWLGGVCDHLHHLCSTLSWARQLGSLGGGGPVPGRTLPILLGRPNRLKAWAHATVVSQVSRLLLLIAPRNIRALSCPISG